MSYTLLSQFTCGVKLKKWLIAVVLYTISTSLYAQVTITFPYTRIVLQRDNAQNASVFVKGQCPSTLDRIEARMVARVAGQGTTTGWQTIESTPISGFYSGSLTASGGWYNLEVRGIINGNPVGQTATLERVGIGEVLLVAGHSNAQGGASPSIGSTDDRVSCVEFPTGQMWQDYDRTGDTAYLPFNFANLQDTIAPFHSEAWYWSQLGDSLTHRLNVPVLFFGAAFGGSSMEQTYKSAYDIPFEHGFIKYGIRMPYVNIRNTLSRYVPVTGLRGILSCHGVNDGGSSTSEFRFYSEQVVAKSRQETNHPGLAWMVAIAAWNNGPYNHIIEAQQQQIAGDAQTYVGANLNLIGNYGRTDNLHFNFQGQVEAARLWADAIVGSPFITQTTVMQPKPQIAGLPPVTQASGTWGNDPSWRNSAAPAETSKVYIKQPHTIEVDSPKTAKALHLAGTINLVGNGQLYLTGN